MFIINQYVGFGAGSPLTRFPLKTGSITGNSGGASTSYNAPLPADIQAGELLLLIVATESGAAGTIATPSEWSVGWNEIGGGTLRRFVCFYKIATGSEGASVALTSTNSRWVSVAYRIASWSGVPQFGAMATGTSSAANPPSLSLSSGGATLWIAAQAIAGNVTTAVAAPTNYTDLIQDTVVNGGDDRPRVAAAVRLLGAISEDPGAFSVSATNWAANTIAVRAA